VGSTKKSAPKAERKQTIEWKLRARETGKQINNMIRNSRHSASVMRRPLGTSFATSLVKMTCLRVVKQSTECRKMKSKMLTDIRIDRRCIYRCSKFAWAYLCAIRLITKTPVPLCPFERMIPALCVRQRARRAAGWMRQAIARAPATFKTLPPPRTADKRHFSWQVYVLPLNSTHTQTFFSVV
jgi:hypothetical protein